MLLETFVRYSALFPIGHLYPTKHVDFAFKKRSLDDLVASDPESLIKLQMSTLSAYILF